MTGALNVHVQYLDTLKINQKAIIICLIQHFYVVGLEV